MSESASVHQESETSILLREIEEAVEPVSQFWPMRAFVHHNPIHGLEHLPFDDAVQEARHLFGAEGYLPNEEYREFHRAGRIADRSVERALRRVGPRLDDRMPIRAGTRTITPAEILRLHLLFGIEPLEPALLSWQLDGEGVLEELHRDLPAESRRKALESGPPERYLTELWEHALRVLGLFDPRDDIAGEEESHRPDQLTGSSGSDIDLPFHRSVSDWVGELAEEAIVDAINDQMIPWVAAFVDEGLAGWEMPGRDAGFYGAWRELARTDATGRLLGIEGYAQKLNDLPPTPEAAILRSLHRLGIPQTRWRHYLARVLAQLPGWTGFIRWRDLNPDHPAQKKHPIVVVHYLAVRLFYEEELTRVVSRRAWGVDPTLPTLVGYWRARPEAYAARLGTPDTHDSNTGAVCRDAWRLFHLFQFLALSPDDARGLSREDAETLLVWLDGFPPDRHGPVWLEAYEDSYRENVLAKLSAHRRSARNGERPRAQAVFCIDVRSEPFRRHLEARGPYETLGFAGFFGIPIHHRVFDTDESVALCPVLLTPNHALFEVPRPGQKEMLDRYAAGSRWSKLGEELFHDLKQNPIAAFMLIDVLGIFFSVRLIGKTFIRRPYQALTGALRRWFVNPVATEIPPDSDGATDASVGVEAAPSAALTRGFTIEERASFVENGLRTMGLTKNLGRFVVLCGHGGNSDNNPYFAALHCGACGGRPGDPNARVFAAMGNDPDVRRVLSERGLVIPEDTWFLGGKHDTNSDRVSLYDLEDVPESHAEDLRAFQRDLERAGAHQAQERCRRIPGAPQNASPERAFAHVDARSFDWANPRPEWGLSGNAGFIIGRRSLTQGLDLEGRVFLNSYDPESDPRGEILEKIMTAPLIVGEWISMEHYFSAADPWNYGSGSKVIHNVVSGVGLMLGSQSDLQTGLPLQTVNNGKIHHHEPMRLLAIIEANHAVIGAIIQRHEVLQQLFHNQWVNLVALDPVSFELHRYNPDATWEPIDRADLSAGGSSLGKETP